MIVKCTNCNSEQEYNEDNEKLKVLRQSDLVRYKRSGKNVIYSLADDHVRDIIERALEHIKE